LHATTFKKKKCSLKNWAWPNQLNPLHFACKKAQLVLGFFHVHFTIRN